MGYRSDVVIEMEDKAYELMHKALLKLKKSGEYALPIITKDADTYYLKWEGFKWYTDFGFQDVDAVENVLKELKEKHSEEDGYSYYKIRIGESYDDIETECNNSCYSPIVYVERHIAGADFKEEVTI